MEIAVPPIAQPDDFDFDPAGVPTKFYAICTTPRSGSTLVCSQLWREGRMGAPREYFNLNGDLFRLQALLQCRNIAHYTDELLRRRTSPNGVFGLKLFFDHWHTFLSSGRLERFGKMKFVHLQRRDRVAQAVSRVIATQTGLWDSATAARGAATYDFDAVLAARDGIEKQHRAWEQAFARLKAHPLELVYEEFCEDPAHHVAQICRFVGVDPAQAATPLPVPTPTRQATAINAEWIERFNTELAGRGAEKADEVGA